MKKANAGRLEVLYDTQTIINTYLHILHNANSRWDYFADNLQTITKDSNVKKMKVS